MRKIKTVISMLLCISMLSSVLISCGKGSETSNDSSADISDDFGEFDVIVADKISSALRKSVKQFVDSINGRSGGAVKIYSDADKVDDGNRKELLIGFTDRAETASALEAVGNEQYVLRRSNDKIVVAGASDTLTARGVEYFMQNYVSDAGKITMADGTSYVSGAQQVLTLADNKRSDFKIVYSKALDNTTDSNSGYYPNGGVDHEVSCAGNICETIYKRTGVNISISTDNRSTDNEILVGRTSRDETAAAMNGTAANEYGFKVIGSKVVVFGWNGTTMMLAAEEFAEWVSANASIKNDQTVILQIAADTQLIKTYSDWVVDFPEYGDGSFIGTVDGDGGNLVYCYGNTDRQAFLDYCDGLVSEGYTEYTSNAIANNLYTTYTREDHILHVWYTDYEKTVRITSGSITTSNKLIPTSNAVGEKVTDSSLTQLTHNYDAGGTGMGYVITLEDGRFIVIDGGVGAGSDHVMLYKVLNKLNKRADGKIVIAAWLMSHDHVDHFMLFKSFCDAYGSQVTIERYVYNTPSISATYNAYDPTRLTSQYFAAASKAAGGIEMIRVYTGQKFSIANAQIEILLTPDDMYPDGISFYNDASVIYRVTVGGQRLLFLGDAGGNQSTVVSDRLCGMYANELRADIVQMAHHGFGHGATKEMYDYIGPDVAFWDTSDTHYNKFLSGGYDYDGSYGVVNRYVATELAKENYTASCVTTIKLPYTVGSGQVERVSMETVLTW